MSDKDTTEVTENTEETTEAVETTEAQGAEGEFEFAEAPSFDIDYQGECVYAVKVSIPAANTKKQSEELFGELQDQAELPGFRRGRAPRALLEKKFGKAVRGEATEKLVGAAFRKLVQDEELKPLDFPDIDGLEDVLEKAEDAPIEFTMRFEVSPRCTLGDYKGIEIEKPVMKVEDEDIDRALDGLRQRFATFETAEGVKAENGDQVIIDFKGTIDGEEFAGGAAENYPYILGSGRFFKEFEDAIQGAETGAELTAQVAFPEDYSGAEVAGKTADFAIKVNEIKRRALPEITDEFAKQAGEESAESLRERVANDLREGASSQSDQIAENSAIEKIVELSTFEIPASLIDSSAEEYYQQEVRRLAALRVSAAELRERDEDIRKEARENAIQQIKGFVAVNEVANAEKIEVTEEDFEKEAAAIQQRTGMGMEVVQRFLAQSDQRDSYESRIYRQKAMAVVMENAKITEKEVTREELEKEDDEESDA